MTIAAIHAIVAAAHNAFEAGRAQDLTSRAGWLRALADVLETNAEELVELAHQESHLPLPRLQGELKRTAFQLRLLATEIEAGSHLDVVIDHADSEWGMGPRPDLRRMNQALGVVVVFGASNFPFAFSVLGGDTASALAAGCAVVHKAHPDHLQLARRTGELAVAALAAAGAPAGIFALVEDPEAGVPLVEEPLVRAVGFTGSTAGGRALFDKASARPDPIPFFGELGSTNPVFVTAAAWAARGEEILAGFAGSATLGMGQFCTKPGFLILPVEQVPDGAALVAASGPQFGMLSERIAAGFHQSVAAVGAREGVAEITASSGGVAPEPVYLTVSSAEVLAQPELLETEMFGPASVIITGADISSCEEIAGALSGQLTATIWAEPEDQIDGLVRILEQKAGRILFCEWPTGVTVSYAQHHGGPYPASTAPATTSVGTAAITRFMRPVAYQSFPELALPQELQESNPLKLRRRVDGRWD